MPYDSSNQGNFLNAIYRTQFRPGLSAGAQALLKKMGQVTIQEGIPLQAPVVPFPDRQRLAAASVFLPGTDPGGDGLPPPDGSGGSGGSGSSGSGGSGSGDSGSSGSSGDSGGSGGSGGSGDSGGSGSGGSGSGGSGDSGSGDSGRSGGLGSGSGTSGGPLCICSPLLPGCIDANICPGEIGGIINCRCRVDGNCDFACDWDYINENCGGVCTDCPPRQLIFCCYWDGSMVIYPSSCCVCGT